MGKKGGGGAGSSKALQKRREKAVEDKTFGLKNKNKSQKVQQYVATMQASVGKGAAADRRNQEKKKAKEAAAAAKAEFDALFKTAKTKKEKMKEQEKAKPLTEEEKWMLAFEKLSDAEKVDKLLFSQDKFVLKRTLEDRVEECRNYIEKKTPITALVFRQWINDREAAKQQRLEAEKADRLKRGRLTGRELWPTLVGHIKDDEGAAGTEEMARREEEEEDARQKEEEDLRRQDEQIAMLREKAKKGKTEEDEEYEEALKAMAEEQGVEISAQREEEGDDLDGDLAAEMEGLEDEDLDGLEEAMLNAEL